MRTVTFDETEWQLVPKTPTFLMIEAGGEAHDCEDVYRDMLAISPPPPNSTLIYAKKGVRPRCPACGGITRLLRAGKSPVYRCVDGCVQA